MAAVAGGPEPEYVHGRSGFAFDATVIDLADSTDVATARWAAKVLELPIAGLPLTGAAWPWGPTIVLVLLALPGTVLAGALAGAVRRRDRTVPVRVTWSVTSNNHQDPRPASW